MFDFAQHLQYTCRSEVCRGIVKSFDIDRVIALLCGVMGVGVLKYRCARHGRDGIF